MSDEFPHSYESDLAGIKFRPADVKERIRTLPIGTILNLERELDNPYDANAIKVLTIDGIFLGYIQSFVAQRVSMWIDKNFVFKCQLKSFNGPKATPVLTLEPIGEIVETHTADFNPHGADDDIPS